MAQVVFNHVGGGQTTVLWWHMLWFLEEKDEDVSWFNQWPSVECDREWLCILDPDNLTNQDKTNKQCNTMALNTIYNAIDSKVFEQIKDCERANEVWKRLKETYEGAPTVKSAKLYILR